MSSPSAFTTFVIPARTDESMTGSAFAAQVMDLPLGPAREEAIYAQLAAGNIPDFMRFSCTVTSAGAGYNIFLEVLPDVLCIGTDEDFVRVPMNPKTAQRVADLFGASLITPAVSDIVWRQADVRIDPMQVTMKPCPEMTSTKWFVDQNAKVEHERAGRIGLIAGHKKDVVLANSLALPEFHDKRVAIYGWHQLNGRPIQQLNPLPGTRLTHEITYADYSHGVRLVSAQAYIDDTATTFLDLVSDKKFSSSLNGQPLLYTRYPTS